MKKIWISIFCAILITVIFGCSTKNEEQIIIENESFEEGVQTDVGDDTEEIDAEEVGTEDAEPEVTRVEYVYEDIDISRLQQGDIVIFGHYEQDGNSGNGLEPIQWDVVKVDGNKVLLFSHYVLDYRQIDSRWFDPGYGKYTWETSEIREWLNGDFYNTAFNTEEQGKIADTYLENKGSSYFRVSENDTTDKVFSFNIDDFFKYFYCNHERQEGTAPNGKAGNFEQLMREPTPYVASLGASTGNPFSSDSVRERLQEYGYDVTRDVETTSWFCRETAGDGAWHVTGGGNLDFGWHSAVEQGICPAIWITVN